jgi:hypothetical protein
VCYRKICKDKEKGTAKYRSTYTYEDQMELARVAIQYKDDPKHLFRKYSALCMFPLHQFFEESCRIVPLPVEKKQVVLGALAKVQNGGVEEQEEEEEVYKVPVYDTDDALDALGGISHSSKKQRKSETSRSKKKRHRDVRAEKDDRETEEVRGAKRKRKPSSHSDVGDNSVVSMFCTVMDTIESMRTEIAEYTKNSEDMVRRSYERGAEDAYKRMQENQKKELDRLISDAKGTLNALDNGASSAKKAPRKSERSLKKRSRYEDISSDEEEFACNDDSSEEDDPFSEERNEEIYTPRPSTRRRSVISQEQFEKDIEMSNKIARGEASSDGEASEKGEDVSDSDFVVDDDSSGIDVEDEDEEDQSVEELDLAKLGHVLQETIDQGRGPSDADAIIVDIDDVTTYVKHYAKADDEDFDPRAQSSASSNPKLSKEMIIEPTKDQLADADKLEQYIKMCDDILKCKTRREMNTIVSAAYKAGVASGLEQYNTDSEICVCSMCRSVATMSERDFIAYYRRHFLASSVILGENDEEDQISDAEVKDARARMLNILRACPQPLEKGLFKARTDWWCIKTGDFFYKGAPQGRQIALVRVSPQERAIDPDVRKDIIGKPLGKPVYYRIPASSDGDDQIFCPGSLSREQFVGAVKKLKRRLKRMRSSGVSEVVFSGSSSEPSADDEDGVYLAASDDDEYDSN